MSSGGFLGARNASEDLDRVIPEHAYRVHPYARRWTTRTGVFEMDIAVDGPNTTISFRDAAGAWRLTVPATVAGVEAVKTLMRLAGAIAS